VRKWTRLYTADDGASSVILKNIHFINLFRERRERRKGRARLCLPPEDDNVLAHPFVSSKVVTGYISLRNEDTVEQ